MELQKVEEKNYSHNFSILSAKKALFLMVLKRVKVSQSFFISLLSGRFGQRERSRTSVTND